MKKLFAPTIALLLILNSILSTAHPTGVEAISHYASSPLSDVSVSASSRLTTKSSTELGMRYVPGELIVKFRPGVTVNVDKRTTTSSSFNALLASSQVSDLRPLLVLPDNRRLEDIPVLNKYYKIKVPQESDIDTLTEKFMQSPDVEFATPNYLLQITRIPDDPHFPNQWVLNDSANAKLHVPTAWDIIPGTSNIVVAVLDTGLDITHPDLDSKNTLTGFNFVISSTNIMDDQGHGTSVSGIIAAESNNGYEVAGMSWGAMIMPVKVCDSNGSCTEDAIFNGLRWAADHGARIANLSLLKQVGGFGAIMAQEAVDYAYANPWAASPCTYIPLWTPTPTPTPSNTPTSTPTNAAAPAIDPGLSIPDEMRAAPGGNVIAPVAFSADGHDISSLVFSLDFDQTWLTFDPTDDDGDGIPNAVTLNLPLGFDGAVTYDADNANGELDFFIADTFPPLLAMPSGMVASVEFGMASPGNTTEAAIDFSDDPAASFGTTSGQSVPGTTEDGSTRICVGPIANEDLNCDGAVNLADVLIAAGLWNNGYVGFDVNGDGVIGISDLQQVVSVWVTAQ